MKTYTEEEFEELNYDKDKLREYFTNVATKMFIRANNMPAGKEKLIQIRTSLQIFKHIDAFIESSYRVRK